MRDWLLTLRKEKGLTGKEMAQRMHISEPYYFLIEQGVRQKEMSIRTALLLAQSLEIPARVVIEKESETG